MGAVNPRRPTDSRPPGAGGPSRPPGAPETSWPRWVPWLVALLVVSALVLSSVGRGSSKEDFRYSEFLNQVKSDQVERVKIDQVSGRIDGVLKNGKEFHVNGPQNDVPDKDIQLLADHNVARDYKPRWSDFMEMFVGVGAARVRDLFQTARKQAPAIIFVDEIDSIGRKRGAGLGGGHDEREQTLNQMLSEMDGFETTEGIVMMAATNRPDILDSALLRPGRFDRQIVVPLPTQSERLAILEVHCKDKRIGPDVDLDVVARGTPGMSGADLANLVNEAALFAVRRGADKVAARDFEDARDRVLMGQRRESMDLSDDEKEVIAYHEGGHAVLAYVLPNADPVHKVTILPSGMALGVTQQLPVEEKHIYRQDYIEDSLVVRLGGRLAEEAVYNELSTGANNDLVGCTELARKMVREWGMSNRIGPMAWGSQGAVFLGEDLMHTRDYSDDTARVIDEEVERILREQEERGRRVLREHRPGLDAVAASLLEHETIDGEEVGRLVDEAAGRRVGGGRRVPRLEPDGEVGPSAAVRPASMAPAAPPPRPVSEPNGEGERPPARPTPRPSPRPAEST